MNEFVPFPKMARLSRDVVITEKLDGTNAQILIKAGYKEDTNVLHHWHDDTTSTDMVMYAGSRTRWITPKDDNFGFAAWALANVEELKQLGEGSHFGEWWGRGIQRTYRLANKKFSLFNTGRWYTERPSCCDVVPIIYDGLFDTAEVDKALATLKDKGSVAAPGFMNPEGVVVFHLAGRVGFKKTLGDDAIPKSLVRVTT